MNIKVFRTEALESSLEVKAALQGLNAQIEKLTSIGDAELYTVWVWIVLLQSKTLTMMGIPAGTSGIVSW